MVAKITDRSAGKVEMTITPPDFGFLKVTIVGTAPLVMNKFGYKARQIMRDAQAAGSQRKKRGAAKEPKDFEQCYQDSLHCTTDGGYGIPCAAFRAAMIRGASLAGFVMTTAKTTVFVEATDYEEDGTALVRITKGTPSKFEAPVRNDSGVADIRVRGMWKQGWEAELTIRYDKSIFTEIDVANLVMRAGMQVGILEGRPMSKDSNGQNWGLFTTKGRK